MIEVIIVHSTVTATPMPNPATHPIPIRSRPSSDTTTVTPAKMTARPAVSIAVIVASRGDRPAWSPFPVAGDDEQGVVDADAEPDHRPQEGGEVGDLEDVAEDDDQTQPGPDTAEGDGDRQAHREDRAEGEDQHDDGEGEADELGLRRFEHGQGCAAREHLETLDGGRGVGDRLAERGRLGQADIGGQVDLGVGELPGQRTLPGDLRLALLGVGRHDGGAGVLGVAVLVGEPGVHGGEELLHRRDHGGVVDALVGAEHDRSRSASGAELGEVLLEHVEAVGALGVGDVGRRVVGGADPAGGAEDHDQRREPDAHGRLAVVDSTTHRHGRAGSRTGASGARRSRGVPSSAAPEEAPCAGVGAGARRPGGRNRERHGVSSEDVASWRPLRHRITSIIKILEDQVSWWHSFE